MIALAPSMASALSGTSAVTASTDAAAGADGADGSRVPARAEPDLIESGGIPKSRVK